MAKSIQEAKQKRNQPTQSRARKANAKTERRGVRRPLSVSMNLDIPQDLKKEDYAYRWIRNTPDRIAMFEAAWWDIVKDGNGKPIQKHAKNSEEPEMMLILMETPLKYFEEDLAENRKKPVDLIAEKAKLKADEYIPDGKKSVVSIKQ